MAQPLIPRRCEACRGKARLAPTAFEVQPEWIARQADP
jgi:hypothetical protein